jgi:hypothetical protein
MKTIRAFALVTVLSASAFLNAVFAAPIQSSPIVVSSDDKSVVVCNPSNASITVLDVSGPVPKK